MDRVLAIGFLLPNIVFKPMFIGSPCASVLKFYERITTDGHQAYLCG